MDFSGCPKVAQNQKFPSGCLVDFQGSNPVWPQDHFSPALTLAPSILAENWKICPAKAKNQSDQKNTIMLEKGFFSVDQLAQAC